MLPKKGVLLLIMVAFVLAACGAMAAEPSLAPVPLATMPAARETAFDYAEASSVAQDIRLQESVQERLIIRTGNLSIVVNDTEESLASIGELTAEFGGWVVSSNVFQVGNAKQGSITVRIPAGQFDNAINRIKEMALEVTAESTSGQDVTEEYVDLSARLQNLEATAERVRAFLDEARDVEDALAVNRELSRLESEIEAMKGRLQYLSQSAAFSTLTVNITPDELAQPIQVGGWRPEGTARNAVQALITALQGVARLFIWLLVFVLPLALVIAIPGWLLVRFLRRLFRRRRQAAAP